MVVQPTFRVSNSGIFSSANRLWRNAEKNPHVQFFVRHGFPPPDAVFDPVFLVADVRNSTRMDVQELMGVRQGVYAWATNGRIQVGYVGKAAYLRNRLHQGSKIVIARWMAVFPHRSATICIWLLPEGRAAFEERLLRFFQPVLNRVDKGRVRAIPTKQTDANLQELFGLTDAQMARANKRFQEMGLVVTVREKA